MPRGGARPNSGPKKGSKNGPQKATISKEQARDALRQIVLREMDALVQAQVQNARGLMHMMLRNEDGTWRKAINADEILTALNGPTDRYWISVKDPSIQAFTDLMNRALDKPKEQEQEVKIDGGLVITWQE